MVDWDENYYYAVMIGLERKGLGNIYNNILEPWNNIYYNFIRRDLIKGREEHQRVFVVM